MIAASGTFGYGLEFKTIVDHSVTLGPYPELKQYLLDYPRTALPSVETFFYWQEASFGLKRTIHLSQAVIAERLAALVEAQPSFRAWLGRL